MNVRDQAELLANIAGRVVVEAAACLASVRSADPAADFPLRVHRLETLNGELQQHLTEFQTAIDSALGIVRRRPGGRPRKGVRSK